MPLCILVKTKLLYKFNILIIIIILSTSHIYKLSPQNKNNVSIIRI